MPGETNGHEPPPPVAPVAIWHDKEGEVGISFGDDMYSFDLESAMLMVIALYDGCVDVAIEHRGMARAEFVALFDRKMQEYRDMAKKSPE